MGLDVGVFGAEELLGPIAGEVLGHVDPLAPAVVTLARIALGVLVRQHASDGLHHGGAGVVLAGDHLQPVLLALDFALDGGPEFGVLGFEVVHGEGVGIRAIRELGDWGVRQYGRCSGSNVPLLAKPGGRQSGGGHHCRVIRTLSLPALSPSSAAESLIFR